MTLQQQINRLLQNKSISEDELLRCLAEILVEADYLTVEEVAYFFPTITFPQTANKDEEKLAETPSSKSDSILPFLPIPEIELDQRYTVLKTLGEGGMGIVQLVKDHILEREVALKKTKLNEKNTTHFSKSALMMRWRLNREASITAILEHPNIVPLYDMQRKISGEMYFTMRKIEGETLRKLLKRKSQGLIKHDENRLLSIFFKICDAVSYAHSKGIVHRDLKPDNIMVGKFGEVYVVDWGIAKRLHSKMDSVVTEFPFVLFEKNNLDLPESQESKTLTETTPVDEYNEKDFKTVGGIGTVGYMAPEQKLDAFSVTPQADIYTLGKILRECFTCLSPIEELKQEIQHHTSPNTVNGGIPKKLPPFAQKIPTDIQAIVKKATATKRAIRYQTVKELEEDLERYQKKLRVSVREYSFFELFIKWGERNWKSLTILMLTVLLCAFAATGVAWWKQKAIILAKEKAEKMADAEKIAKEKARRLAQDNAILAAQEKKGRQELERRLFISIAQDLLRESTKQYDKGKHELGMLLAKQAYLFNQSNQGHLLNQIDDVLRPMLKQPFFSTTLTGHKKPISAIAISPNGKYLASASEDQTVRLWDITRPQSPPIVFEKIQFGITAITFHPKGYTLAIGCQNGSIYLMDLIAPQKPLQELSGHKDSVTSLSFSSDGKILASGSWDYRIYLWDLESPKKPHLLTQHINEITAIAFHPSKPFFVSCSQDGTLRQWDYSKKECPSKLLRTYRVGLRSLNFNAQGNFLALGAEKGAIYLWDFHNKPKPFKKIFHHKATVNAVVFSPKGNWLASGSSDSTILLWNLADLTSNPVALSHHQEDIEALSFSPDGKFLVSGSWDSTIRIWNLVPALTIPPVLKGHQGEITSLAFSPDGTKLASGATDKIVLLWDLLNPSFITSIYQEHQSEILALAFSADNRYLASSGKDGFVYLRDLTRIGLTPIKLEHEQDIIARLAFHPQNNFLITGGKNLYFWDLNQQPPKPIILQEYIEQITALAFHPNGDLLAVGNRDRTVTLITFPKNPSKKNVNSQVLKGHQHYITSLSFHPSEPYLVSSSWDKTIRWWDLRDLSHPLSYQLEHYINAISFSKNDHTLAIGTDDQTIQLQHSKDFSGEPLHLKASKFGVKTLSFSPDGFLLAASESTPNRISSSIFLWFSTSGLAQQVNSQVRRNLSLQEWHQFIGEEIPYEKTCPHLPIHPSLTQEALSYLKQGQIEHIFKWFSPSLKETVKGEMAMKLLEEAQLLQKNGQYEQAVAALKQAKALSQTSLILRGKSLAQQGLVEEAKFIFQQALQLNPHLKIVPEQITQQYIAQGYLQKAQQLAIEGLTQEAILLFEKAQILNPNFKQAPKQAAHELLASTKLIQATSYAQEANYLKAFELFQEAVILDPSINIDPKEEANSQTVQGLLSKGWQMGLTGKVSQASLLFKKANLLNPDLKLKENELAGKLGSPSLMLAGEELAREGLVTQAIEIFEKAMRWDPRLSFDPKEKAGKLAAPVLVQQGREALQELKFKDTLKYFEKALQLDAAAPINAEDWNLLCWFGCLYGNATNVIAAGEKAVKLDLRNGNYRDSLGLARALTGDFPGAIQDFRYFIDWTTQLQINEYQQKQRKEWIQMLKVGHNPFTPSLLEKLKQQ